MLPSYNEQSDRKKLGHYHFALIDADDAILEGSISDILQRFSCENFYFGCTFWTFQNRR